MTKNVNKIYFGPIEKDKEPQLVYVTEFSKDAGELYKKHLKKFFNF